jgi:hypothetical protein
LLNQKNNILRGKKIDIEVDEEVENARIND